MKYNNYKWTVALVISCVSFIGCDRYDVDEVSLSAVASSDTIKVGETVEFSIEHSNAATLVVFTGDQGHDYLSSSDYMLAGLTKEELNDSIYRIPNPLIRKFSLDFANLDTIPSVIEYPNMELVDDALTPDKKALKLQLFPDDWSKVLKVYPRVGVGAENQDFTVRLRFETNELFKKVGTTWVPGSTKANFRVVTEVIGKTADGKVIWTFNQGSPNSVWYTNLLTPNVAYFNSTINLTKWIANWEAGNKQKLQTIECITLKFLGDANAAYQGNIFISSMTLGVDGYYPFATGASLPINNGSGKKKFSYSYNKPGVYNVTFVGSGNSLKNYSGDGYQTDRNGLSGEEFKYNVKRVTIPVVVVE